MEIVLVKQTDERLSEADGAVVRKFLFGHLSGATDKDTKAWYRFCRALNESGSGEYFSITIKRQRSGPAHRRHMALITKVFNAQERLGDFPQFRLWLAVGSGFVTWCSGPKGGIFPVPRSINFNTCSEEDFQDYHRGVIEFFRKQHAQHYLWRHLSPQVAEETMENILKGFGE